MEFLKKYWWKVLGMLLVVYAVVMSFIVPLGPGIIDITPTQTEVGYMDFEIHGYNTEFFEGRTSFYLANPERTWFIQADNAAPENDQEIAVQFTIPAVIPCKTLDLYLNNDMDGICILPAAISVLNGKIDSTAKTELGAPVEVFRNGESFNFPFKSILYESIRNLNFHVTMWFALLFCMLVSLINSIRYLRQGDLMADVGAVEGVKTGLLFGVIGLITGSIWARFTWGAWWVNDTKLNGAAISVLIYLAYLLLRNSIPEEQKRARISAVYNIFAFVMLIVFIQVLPRLTDSLHPGNGGNPAFGQYDLDNNLRLVFYPAVIGWCLLAAWIMTLRVRISNIIFHLTNND